MEFKKIDAILMFNVTDAHPTPTPTAPSLAVFKTIVRVMVYARLDVKFSPRPPVKGLLARLLLQGDGGTMKR